MIVFFGHLHVDSNATVYLFYKVCVNIFTYRRDQKDLVLELRLWEYKLFFVVYCCYYVEICFFYPYSLQDFF